MTQWACAEFFQQNQATTTSLVGRRREMRANLLKSVTFRLSKCFKQSLQVYEKFLPTSIKDKKLHALFQITCAISTMDIYLMKLPVI